MAKPALTPKQQVEANVKLNAIWGYFPVAVKIENIQHIPAHDSAVRLKKIL